MTNLRSFFLLALLVAVTTAATCGGPDPIDFDDHARFTPTGRASYEILPGNGQRRRGSLLDLASGKVAPAAQEKVEGERSHRVQATFSIDGEIAHVEGRDHPIVEAGQEVKLPDGPTSVGPTRVDLQSTAFYGHVAGRGGVRFLDMISLEGIVGLGINHTELELEDAGVDSRDGSIRPGFLIGARTTVRPIPLFDLYAQATFDALLTDGGARDFQVGVDLNLTPNVSVFGGHHWYRFSEDHDSASNVRINLRGPIAGVALKF